MVEEVVGISLTPHEERDSDRTPPAPSVGYQKRHRRLRAYSDAKRPRHVPHGAFGRHHPVRAALHQIGRLLENEHRH
jgi:hypothetical protein